jgi:Yip1 domain
MSLIPTPEARAALIERAKNILLQPKAEWPKIEAEPASVGSIYSNYVIYVAAIPVLATLIGSLVFGYGIAGVTFRPSLGAALTTAVLQYALQLGAVYVFALIIDWLAPRFGGESNRVNAFKLAAYSATASWLAGAFALVPALAFLSILGLYSIYLLYTGAPVLMKIAGDRAFTYTAAVIVAGILLSLIVGAIGAAFLPSPVQTMSEVGGKVTLPGGITVDTNRLDEATKHLEQITKQMEQRMPGAQGAADDDKPTDLPKVALDDLKALLPESLPGGLTRSDLSTSTGGAAGFNFGSAKANYARGDARITVSLMDMGALGAFAALGGIFGASASEETETSYSKIGEVDGRMTIEEFNSATNSGKYVTIVDNRIMVEADGSGGATIDELKAAVLAIDLARVAALAKQ